MPWLNAAVQAAREAALAVRHSGERDDAFHRLEEQLVQFICSLGLIDWSPHICDD